VDAAAQAARPRCGVGGLTGRLLTARELAEYLGVSADTVLDWFEGGKLPGFRLGGRKGGPVRFRLEEIEATLQGWHVNGPSTGGESVTQPLEARPADYPSRRHPTLIEQGGEGDAC
jgi:excisionase family DNA binding protein